MSIDYHSNKKKKISTPNKNQTHNHPYTCGNQPKKAEQFPIHKNVSFIHNGWYCNRKNIFLKKKTNSKLYFIFQKIK